MKGSLVALAVAVLCGAAVASGQQTPAISNKSVSVHNSACGLGDSMASKLHFKQIGADEAKDTCQRLAPTMDDAGLAEYMRCCTVRLLTGKPAPATK